MTRVFHFNPSCEMEVANQLPHFHPPKQVNNLLHDGQHLPVYFTAKDDCVLVNDMPSKKYMKGLVHFGLAENRFVPIQQHIKQKSNQFTPSPWGWSPSIAKRFSTWFPEQKNAFVWKPEFEHWYRRETSAEILKEIVAKFPENQFSKSLLPEICTDISSVERCLKHWGKIVMKAPLSSSGRGVQFLRKQPLNASNKQWIQGILDQQGSVMVERLLDKVFDFSLHYYKDENGMVEFISETAFLTNSNGKYRGNFIGAMANVPDFPPDFDVALLEKTKSFLMEAFKLHPAYEQYTGFLGVDMMIYKEDNVLKLHPCVEINARQSMGLVAIHLEKYIKGGVKAQFSVELKSEVEEASFFIEKEDGLIRHCYWPLSDYWQSKQFVFVLKVK